MEKTITEKKKILRKAVKEQAMQLDEQYFKDANEKICGNAVALDEFQRAETVFCYVGTPGEIDTRPILEKVLQSGKKLGVPKCIFKGVMEVYQVESPDDLEKGSYGIPEPKEGCRMISPQEIDLAFVPCLCCSREGVRLGYGGGYYDGYLRGTAFTKIALCREELIRQDIPADSHDVPMDGVLSENGFTAVKKPQNR